MIELPREPQFARIYKTWFNGNYMFQGFSAKTQEEYDQAVASIEKQEYFRCWVTDVEDANSMDYYFSQKVRKLNDDEKARVKTPIEQLETSMYVVQRAVETAESSVAALRKAHLAAIAQLEQLKLAP